jgi:hypothetical protein
MTWSLYFLTDHPSMKVDWRLVETRAENAAESYSNQDMFVWSASQEPVISGRLSAANFI